jgi:hypothetical protein
MRRLAKQSREDTYKSNRDYQSLHDRRAQRFVPRGPGSSRLVFTAKLQADSTGLACWGGYVLSKSPTTILATLSMQERNDATEIKVEPNWQRFGALVTGVPPDLKATLTLEWYNTTPVEFWGLGIGRPNVPKRESGNTDLSLLEQSHLIPETFYLLHQAAVDAEIEAEESKRFRIEDGSTIKLKKCSYCGRLLPVDPARLGVLAFHKHNAKISKHQNECRACKKWRINDSFNPLRTTDQLHESSVITRERKLFLREPEILQAIKDRTGAGLKSKVWERFRRKCFRCGDPVGLDHFHLDHTRPLAYLWPIDEYATCLCAGCNNEKKEKFPVDFYKPQELKQLSEITGLPLAELAKKELNRRELKRILNDLPTFARDWEPRTFLATARKIRELRPDIDLLVCLKAANRLEFQRLERELKERPPPVGEDEE